MRGRTKCKVKAASRNAGRIRRKAADATHWRHHEIVYCWLVSLQLLSPAVPLWCSTTCEIPAETAFSTSAVRV